MSRNVTCICWQQYQTLQNYAQGLMKVGFVVATQSVDLYKLNRVGLLSQYYPFRYFLSNILQYCQNTPELSNITFIIFESYSYLTGASAAALWRHVNYDLNNLSGTFARFSLRRNLRTELSTPQPRVASLALRKASQIARFVGLTWVHLGLIGPRWPPCWTQGPCYQGCRYPLPTN